MSKRALSRAVLLSLLFALAASPANVVASLNGDPTSSREQAKARVGRMVEGAQKSAIYDHDGRAVKTTVPTSDGEKVAVSLKYDGRNRLQAVVCDDGTRIGLVYDVSGQWQGFSFPDGGRMLFVRDHSGAIIGFRRVAKSAAQRVHSAGKVGVRRVAFGAPLFVGGCKDAVAAAAAAAAVAAATCSAGVSIECATAVAAAAVAAKIAYDACVGSDTAMEMET